MSEIPVTVTAVSRGRLSVMPQLGEVQAEHRFTIPAGLCPRSGNPISGTLTLKYAAREVLEVVTLHRAYLDATKEARSLEGIGRLLSVWCAEALSVRVVWLVDAEIKPGPQRLIVEGTS
jgi:hypothetical protein